MRVKVLAIVLAVAVAGVVGVRAQSSGATGSIQEGGRIRLPGFGRVSMIGVRLGDVTAETTKTYKLPRAEGAIVEHVNPNSPAAAAGLSEKDVIVIFDGERVRSAAHLTRLVQETPAGREVMLGVMRDGRRTDLRITPQSGGTWFDPRFGDVLDVVTQGVGDAPANRGRSRLGVNVQAVSGELGDYFGVKAGVLITAVRPDTPGARAGLKAGDVITAVDGKAVASAQELLNALPAGDARQEINLTVMREKKELTLRATL
jgi:serine protease Do